MVLLKVNELFISKYSNKNLTNLTIHRNVYGPHIMRILLLEITFSDHDNRKLKYEYEYKQTTVTYIWAVNMCLEGKSSSRLSLLNEEGTRTSTN